MFANSFKFVPFTGSYIAWLVVDVKAWLFRTIVFSGGLLTFALMVSAMVRDVFETEIMLNIMIDNVMILGLLLILLFGILSFKEVFFKRENMFIFGAKREFKYNRWF